MSVSDEFFGPRLRGLRLSRGLSLAELARRVHYSKGHLSKIENGLAAPTELFAKQCEGVLGVEGELLGLVSPVAKRSAKASLSEIGEEVWVMTMGPEGESSFAATGRRGVLKAGVASLVGLGVGAGRSPRTASARAEHAIPRFHDLFGEIRRLGQSVSPGVVLPMVIAQAQALRSLAPDVRGGASAELGLLAARTAEYAGWMAQESGDNSAALWWTRTAVSIADEMGDRDLATYALVRQALVAMYQGDARATVTLAQRAQSTSATPRRILGLAAQREAQGHALAGSYDQCMRSLERAASHLAAARADPMAGPVLGTSHVDDPVAVVTGWCLYDLGRTAEAAEVLDRQVPLIPAHAIRAKVRFGVRQALAHAASGEIDRACALAEEMVPSALTVDSETISLDVRGLATTLRRWHTSPAVRQVEPMLASALYRGR